MLKKIDHIAIVVRSIEEALKVYRDALGLPLAHVQEVPEQKVKIAFLPVGDCEIELVEPTTADSGVARFLEKRGEGLHHIASRWRTSKPRYGIWQPRASGRLTGSPARAR